MTASEAQLSPTSCFPRTSRREFLALLAGTACLAQACSSTAAAAEPDNSLIDVNVSLGQWPLRRLPCDQPEVLVSKLRARGVTQAWVGSYEGLLQRDLATVNARLVAACARHGQGLLVPFGSVDPTQPDWEEELRRCAEVHRMPGIRLHPNYHGYALDDAQFPRLVQRAAEARLIVQLALVMEDERMMNPRWRVDPVDTTPLAQMVSQWPGLRLVLLNALRTLRGTPLEKLLAHDNVSVEISMLEGVGGVERLLEQVPAHRVMFGSHAPLFYFEAAELKLKESRISVEQLRVIRSDNAQRLLAWPSSTR